jgi:dimethylamine monooxygenase subunit A
MTSALPKHRPYLQAGAMFQIGLQPMDMATWLDVGSDHARFMAEKRLRLTGRPPVYYRSIVESLAAQVELRDIVVAQLLVQHPDNFRMEQGQLHDLIDGSCHALSAPDLEPLEIAANVLEEDFILFEKHDGAEIMTAASNAYTSSGRIVSCVGRDMRYAHDPVPGLNEQLGPRIDRVMANVKAGAPVVRFNWFVTAISSRLFPQGWHHANVTAAEDLSRSLVADPSGAGDKLWLRVERQTFVRLPQTGALAFGIHTYSDPLSSLAGDRDSLVAIHRLIGEYSEDRLRYSGLLTIRAPLLQWIERQLS